MASTSNTSTSCDRGENHSLLHHGGDVEHPDVLSDARWQCRGMEAWMDSSNTSRARRQCGGQTLVMLDCTDVRAKASIAEIDALSDRESQNQSL
jgi:hypothetical protein